MSHIKSFKEYHKINEDYQNPGKNKFLKAFCIPIGNVNSVTGQTMYDWSIFDEHQYVFLCDREVLLVARKDTFQPGDFVFLLSNEGRQLSKSYWILDSAGGEEDIKKMFQKHNIKTYNPRAFTKSTAKSLGYCYSVKGTDDIKEKDPNWKSAVQTLNNYLEDNDVKTDLKPIELGTNFVEGKWLPYKEFQYDSTKKLPKHIEDSIRGIEAGWKPFTENKEDQANIDKVFEQPERIGYGMDAKSPNKKIKYKVDGNIITFFNSLNDYYIKADFSHTPAKIVKGGKTDNYKSL